MKKHMAYLGAIRIPALAVVLGFGWSSFVLADEATSPPAPSDQSVQERGVPPKTEGFIVQGNQLKAAPGYVLEMGPNNQMMARPRAGGGRSISLDCSCTDGSGTCGISSSGDVAICHKNPDQPCQSTCQWGVGPSSKIGPPGMR